MRKKERQISDPAKIEAIIAQARVCHLALHDLPAPYVVPLSFGYRDRVLYFHAARVGRKVDLMRANPQVGFEISLDLGDVVGGGQGCEWSVNYRSVIGYGKVTFIEETEEKRLALDQIMAQYAPGEFSYTEAMVKRTLLFKLEIEALSAKGSDD